MKNVIFAGIFAAILCGCTSFEEIKLQADSGDPQKQYEVALMFRSGEGTPASHDKYNEYIMKAVKNGDVPAAWEIVKDIGLKKDIARAKDLAYTLGGTYCSSRALVDAGLVGSCRQVVKRVRP